MSTNSLIEWSDFEKLDIRTGTILQAEELSNAIKPAYKLLIDFGILGQKKSSAQITHLYQPHELIGMQITAVLNFSPKQIGTFMSECLVLGVVGRGGEVNLLVPDKLSENGLKIG